MKLALGLLALGSLAAGGCGDATTDVSYVGTPLFRVRGQLTGELPKTPLVSPKVGIAWATSDSGSESIAGQTVGIRTDAFPAAFDLAIMAPPPANAVGFFGGEPTPGIALGQIWAFDDVDGDGKFAQTFSESDDIAAPDKIFGAAQGLWIGYVVDAEATIAGVVATADPLSEAFKARLRSLEGKYFVYAPCEFLEAMGDASDGSLFRSSADDTKILMFEPAASMSDAAFESLFCSPRPLNPITEEEQQAFDACVSGTPAGKTSLKVSGLAAGQLVIFTETEADNAFVGYRSFGDDFTVFDSFKMPTRYWVDFEEGEEPEAFSEAALGNTSFFFDLPEKGIRVGGPDTRLCAETRVFTDFVKPTTETQFKVVFAALSNLRSGPNCGDPVEGWLHVCLRDSDKLSPESAALPDPSP
ncbi:MAG: hypothetical protein KA712_24405 [Myxococcales bacterium]|nr:hypothetical protein [Myxococcales bacterium]